MANALNIVGIMLLMLVVGCVRKSKQAVLPTPSVSLNEQPLLRRETIKISSGHEDMPPSRYLYIVDVDGAVTMPYIGSVRVLGLTPDQAAKKINDEYMSRGIFRNNPYFRISRPATNSSNSLPTSSHFQ